MKQSSKLTTSETKLSNEKIVEMCVLALNTEHPALKIPVSMIKPARHTLLMFLFVAVLAGALLLAGLSYYYKTEVHPHMTIVD